MFLPCITRSYFAPPQPPSLSFIFPSVIMYYFPQFFTLFLHAFVIDMKVTLQTQHAINGFYGKGIGLFPGKCVHAYVFGFCLIYRVRAIGNFPLDGKTSFWRKFARTLNWCCLACHFPITFPAFSHLIVLTLFYSSTYLYLPFTLSFALSNTRQSSSSWECFLKMPFDWALVNWDIQI